MELLKAFSFVLLAFSSCEAFDINFKSSLMCEALINFPKTVKPSRMSTIDVITAQESSKSTEAFDCFKALIIENEFMFTSFNTLNKSRAKFFNQRKKQYVGIAVDSRKSMDVALQSTTTNHYNHHGFYLIILTTSSTTDLDAMFELLWRSFIYNVNIMVEINNSVKMFTFFPFSPKKCHDTKSVKINEYSNGKWQTSLFFPPKLRNFHKCQLKAACFEYGPSAQRTVNANGSVSLNGSDVEILREISKLLNIEMNFEITTEIGSWGQVWENGSAIGAFELLMKKRIDICANFYYLSELRSKFMQFTQAYFSIAMLMTMPRGAPLTAFEKLFRPFELPVWMFFFGFLLIAFIAVAIICCQSRKTQVLFFDRSINAPIMEMLVVLFGSSQHMMPRKSFSRLLLMTFAMYCFVFRTIYTGSLYKFLQSDGRKKDFETIDELVDDEFDFFMDPSIEHMIQNSKFYERKQTFPPEEYEAYHMKTLDPYSKVAFVTSSDEVLHFNKLNHKNFTYNVCNEIIMTVPVVFYLQKNSYLTEIINEKIDGLKSAGLIDYYISKYLDPKYLRVKKVEQGPRRLNLKELLGAFQLFAFGLLCSAAAFVIECGLRKAMKSASFRCK